jgi:phage tail P2-like protein
MSDWVSGRPFFTALPEVGYQDNDAVDSLTLWVDEQLTAKAVQLQSMWTKLDPVTTDEIYLDYLAFLVGLSGPYWDLKWSTAVKRQMITQAHSIWSIRGTVTALNKVLAIHGISYNLWSRGSLNLTFILPGTFGKDDFTLYIRLPLTYTRFSVGFKEAERTAKNYSGAVSKTRVVYERFYLGYSRLGEPVFV